MPVIHTINLIMSSIITNRGARTKMKMATNIYLETILLNKETKRTMVVKMWKAMMKK